MRTVTIPNFANPFVVIINNITYSYPAGATLSVPDSVADVIDSIARLTPSPLPEPGTPGQVLTRLEHGCGWADVQQALPDGGTEGQFLQISGSGALRWATAYNLPAAADTALGGVKRGASVADATNASDVITQLNALIASLVASGALKEHVTQTT